MEDSFASEWTESACEEEDAGSGSYVAFGLATIVAYLPLCALYASFLLRLAVMLIIPMCLLAALSAATVRGLDNILTQVGLVTCVSLAAKNAVLTMEFAIKDRANSEGRAEAAAHGAGTRLRLILTECCAGKRCLLRTAPPAWMNLIG